MPARFRPPLPSVFGTDLIRRMEDPFAMARRISDEVDRTLGHAFRAMPPLAPMAALETDLGFAPEVDVFERDGRLVVRADLPGMGKDDVQVEVAGDTLILRGERKEEREEEREGYYCCERRYGAFTRSIPLPEGVNPDSAEASFRNGVLEVSLEAPTEEAAQRRRIEIKGEGAETGRTGTV
ncbi:Hsp20/alpha crystallin family protein [Myxococcota bacterium]|nr:Hsp20/alpha crystallin family protein [Myxococcota bacterium]